MNNKLTIELECKEDKSVTTHLFVNGNKLGLVKSIDFSCNANSSLPYLNVQIADINSKHENNKKLTSILEKLDSIKKMLAPFSYLKNTIIRNKTVTIERNYHSNNEDFNNALNKLTNNT